MWEVLVFTLFALLVGTMVWWMWQQREVARHHAQATAELAALGQSMRALAHDLRFSMDIIVATTERARTITPGGLPEVLGSLELAARSAAEMVGSMDGPAARRKLASAEGVVHLGVITLRSLGVPIDLRVDGMIRFSGTEPTALRVVQNLLANAVHETSQIAGGRVRVEIGDGRLRITNPVRNPELLDDSIWREGVSHTGSEGLGLSATRQAAARVGWTVRHEVAERDVAFVVEEQPDPAVESN
jgi:signal transduction histidine kinase